MFISPRSNHGILRISVDLVFPSQNKKKLRVAPFLRLGALSLPLVDVQVTAVIGRMKVKYSTQSHLIKGQSTVCRYWQLMLTKYRVPTSSALFQSNKGSLVSRDLSKKVNIDCQSASSVMRVNQQELLRF